ncbi:MAG: bifunctional phosphoglucose/phosphomannose isomerase [Actinomycetota bacterium]
MSTDFLGVVEDFPLQLRAAFEIASEVDVSASTTDVSSIAVLGMGGSGISGDVLASMLSGSQLFVATIKGYDLPGWVSDKTLVFATSYSGDTEETLAVYDQAKQRGSQIISITTGGTLGDQQGGVRIPGGLQPRAALGYLAIPLLVICSRMGLAKSFDEDIEETIELMQQRSTELNRDVARNPAMLLAEALKGTVPIIYGSEGLSALAAYRWKCQLNECAKVPAYNNSFPELNHNEIVGWAELAKLTAEAMSLVVLRHEGEHARIQKRIDVTVPLIEDHFKSVHALHAEGRSALARLFDLIYQGDFVATYLALSQGVDPAPVEAIVTLKRRMSE